MKHHNFLNNFLIKDGPSQTWLIGHKLITITTSPCSRVATQRGLCDRCSLLCKLGSEEVSTPGSFSPTISIN